MNDVLDRVKKIIAEQLSIENPDTLKDDTNIANDLGADSLDVVELVMALEEEFNIEIPDEDAENITTVGDIVSYIANKVE